jgi:hypothetical protein
VDLPRSSFGAAALAALDAVSNATASNTLVAPAPQAGAAADPCPSTTLTGREAAAAVAASVEACLNAVRESPSRLAYPCDTAAWLPAAQAQRRRPLIASGTAPSSSLETAATRHAADMALKNYFSHTSSPGGASPFQRIAAAGFSGSPQGENIAAGYASVRAAVAGWMCSAGHRANILSCRYNSVGGGWAFGASSTYRQYWVTDFGCAGMNNCNTCY